MAIRLQDEALEPFRNFLVEYRAAYEAMDINRISEFFSIDEAHCFGTGVDEVLTNRESLLYALQRDFSELESISLTPEGELIALQVGDGVCLCTELTVRYVLKATPEQPADMPRIRLTMLLERQNNRWRAVQTHISAALNTQEPERSFPPA